ncbi:IclR family transcriptional regulator [Streptosporangiaceae bacterium NEAU-GS5]|nr:IclR family transcriptional regulator [Streptosporangiaceae bacterium NEAU-GS5]
MSNSELDSDGGGRASVQSVDRAVTILEILARRGETGVTEVATELGVHKSTAFRLVAALERRGLVEQAGDRGKYRLGFGIIRLAGATTAQLDLARESRTVCERLAQEIGETVNIAILEDLHAINISQVRGPAAITGYNWVGQRTPVHATSSGKVLIAFQMDPTLCDPLERYTPETIVSAAALRGQLDEIRLRGYGFTLEELEVGLNAVAAPIRGDGGSVVAAVSASGPSYRLTTDRIPEVAALLVSGARQISERIGFYQ